MDDAEQNSNEYTGNVSSDKELLLHTTTTSDTYVGKSSISSSLVNLLNSIIGVGVLTLPYSFKIDGYVLGLIFLAMNFWLTHLTYTYISDAAQYCQHFQYKEIAEIVFNHKAWGYIIPIIMVVYVSGSLTSYSIAIMDNMFWWAGDSNHNFRTYRIILCVCILYLIVVPLSCLRNLDFMRFNSYVMLVCEAIIVVVIVVFFFLYDKPRAEPVAFKFNFDVMTTLPLMSASMCGHFATPYVYRELKDRNQHKMNTIIILNLTVLVGIYILIGFFGYFTFTEDVHSDVLKTIALNAKGQWYLQMSNIAMLLLIITHFPVTCYGCRMAFESLIWQKGTAPLWGTIVVVVIIVTVLMTLSLFVTEIADVLDVTSTLGGSFVIFVIPACFAICIRKKQNRKWQHFIAPSISIAMGLVQFICSGISTVMRWFK